MRYVENVLGVFLNDANLLLLVLCICLGVCVLQGAIALCEMVEFYGCASRVIFSANSKLRPRAWLTIGRMLKKVRI